MRFGPVGSRAGRAASLRHHRHCRFSWLNSRRMTTHGVIIYWSEEDGAFIAEVPELPGCAADGPTRQAALRNVETVIKEWIETAKELGRPIPQPKGRLLFA